jgi:hypothetical protein
MVHVTLATRESEIRRFKPARSYISKISHIKKGWQSGSKVADCLPSKCGALSSKPSTTKKKNLATHLAQESQLNADKST